MKLDMKNIPRELLIDYLQTIRAMRCFRNPDLIHVYADMDARRKQLHEKILMTCNKDREDTQFSIQFAMLVEDLMEEK